MDLPGGKSPKVPVFAFSFFDIWFLRQLTFPRPRGVGRKRHRNCGAFTHVCLYLKPPANTRSSCQISSGRSSPTRVGAKLREETLVIPCNAADDLQWIISPSAGVSTSAANMIQHSVVLLILHQASRILCTTSGGSDHRRFASETSRAASARCGPHWHFRSFPQAP